MENQGLRGENGLLKTWLGREIQRGDKLEKIDTNSQRMDGNAMTIQRDLENQKAELRDKNAELTDDLRSCKNNQKWIAGISFVSGGALGYFVRGQVGSLTGGNAFASPSGFRPMPMPAAQLPVLTLSDYFKKKL